METLYRKVAVSDTKQFENNVHYYFVTHDGQIVNDRFIKHALFEEYTHRYKYFLVEIPDHTAQLQSDKAELLEALEEANRRISIIKSEPDGIVRETMIDMLPIGIESLIKKHKQ